MVIGILGCGWFGRALAASLTAKGCSVKGSATSPEKRDRLQAEQIPAYLVDIRPEGDSIIDPAFFACDTLIIAFNTKMKHVQGHLAKLQQVIDRVIEHRIKKIIFISSIGVYGDQNTIVNEDTVPLPAKISGATLLASERLLLNNTEFATTVVRFGGLVGPGRHPGRFLAGRTEINNGLAPVNLIHVDDCVGITEMILFSHPGNSLFNAVAPDHPAKNVFYTAAAAAIGLIPPSFLDEKKQWKIVESKFIPAVFPYRFHIDNWFNWLNTAEAI